jgi:hypothetical protein
VQFGWHVLEKVRNWTLWRYHGVTAPKALRFLSEEALDLTAFSKMTVSLCRRYAALVWTALPTSRRSPCGR